MMRIFARSGDDKTGSFLIADGDPAKDPNLPAIVADLGTGRRSRPLPLQQHLKFMYYVEPCGHDPALLKRLLALPVHPV